MRDHSERELGYEVFLILGRSMERSLSEDLAYLVLHQDEQGRRDRVGREVLWLLSTRRKPPFPIGSGLELQYAAEEARRERVSLRYLQTRCLSKYSTPVGLQR